MILYDCLDGRGINVIKQWTGALVARDRGKLNNKLDALAKVTDPIRELPGLLFGPRIGGHQEIWKLKVGASGTGNALRPLVCKGPFNKTIEMTLLVGATEKDDELLPHGVADTAEQHRRHILNDRGRRREHEPVK